MLEIHLFVFFFFHYAPPTKIYTLSLHDALPIWRAHVRHGAVEPAGDARPHCGGREPDLRRVVPRLQDRKSTRLNSSHVENSYAGFCLKKKRKWKKRTEID